MCMRKLPQSLLMLMHDVTKEGTAQQRQSGPSTCTYVGTCMHYDVARTYTLYVRSAQCARQAKALGAGSSISANQPTSQPNCKMA